MEWRGYLSVTAYIVIVIVALAEQLLVLFVLPVTSLLELATSSTEMAVLLRPNRGNPKNIIVKMTTKKSLFTSTSS